MSALEIRAQALGHPGAPPALRDVAFSVAPGERVALVGGNGAGKTTLLKAAVGLLPALGGAVHVAGRSIAGPRQAVEAGAALLFQDPSDQLFGASVLEDVLYGPRQRGLPEPEAQARAREALASTGLTGLAGRTIEALSFGEKKRAALAGLLAMAPSVLLLDEPTAGLDPAGEAALVGLLQAAARRGAAMVIASHAVDVLPLLVDRVLLLGEGRILADGTARSVLSDARLLARASARPPIVTSLAKALWPGGPLPLTLEEAVAWNAPRS